jgi:hypothetical protein
MLGPDGLGYLEFYLFGWTVRKPINWAGLSGILPVFWTIWNLPVGLDYMNLTCWAGRVEEQGPLKSSSSCFRLHQHLNSDKNALPAYTRPLKVLLEFF